MTAAVRQSKSSGLIGLSGIVIHETENTFKVITREDQLKGIF
jgi:ribonuclease P protein subunit POP4